MVKIYHHTLPARRVAPRAGRRAEIIYLNQAKRSCVIVRWQAWRPQFLPIMIEPLSVLILNDVLLAGSLVNWLLIEPLLAEVTILNVSFPGS